MFSGDLILGYSVVLVLIGGGNWNTWKTIDLLQVEKLDDIR